MRIAFTSFGAPFLLDEGQFHGKNSSASRLGVNGAGASQASHALLDSEQTQTFGLLDIETLPVILNDQQQALGFLLDPDAHRGGLRMTGAIMQRFLDDTV